jgi:drug/metabolite transporter (DMT)-like permease
VRASPARPSEMTGRSNCAPARAASRVAQVRRGSVADLMLLVTVTLWALNFSVSKYVLDHGFEPLTYSATRYGVAALVFLAIVLAWEHTVRIGRRDFPIVAGAVALLLANQLSFVFALDLSTATTVALLFGTLPIWTALIARLAGVERLGNQFWIAAALSFGGVALVTAGSDGGLSGNLLGNVLAVLGAATWGAYSVALAPLMTRYSPFRLSAIFLFAVFLALLVLSSAQLADQEWDLGWKVWAAFGFAVLGPLVITNLLWFSAIDRVGPSRAALFANLQPFLAAIIALLLLSEELTMLQVAGGLAIAAGIVFSRRSGPPGEPT